MTGRHKAAAAPKAQTDQNRSKNYLLPDNTVVPPLVDMGVMPPAGAVRKDMYDKFKQINRFLEFLDDLLAKDGRDTVRIIDFGCGKSYLTFIVYYYTTEILRKKADITGLDLKKDVIDHCNQVARKYGYGGLLAALLVGAVSVLPAIAMVRDMDARGRVVNAAAMVCSASAFAAHLGFVAGVDASMILPLFAAKFSGALVGACAALWATRRRA